MTLGYFEYFRYRPEWSNVKTIERDSSVKLLTVAQISVRFVLIYALHSKMLAMFCLQWCVAGVGTGMWTWFEPANGHPTRRLDKHRCHPWFQSIRSFRTNPISFYCSKWKRITRKKYETKCQSTVWTENIEMIFVTWPFSIEITFSNMWQYHSN